MSESSIEAAKNLFIRRWGEMAAMWGISRTMAEIHALLFLTSEPICTDDIMEQLAVSRGSASMNLRQLLNWGLIHRVHRRTDRKEYFDAEKDIWQMFETITRERRRREVQPIVETIERCLQMLEEDRGRLPAGMKKNTEEYQKRFRDMLEFCGIMNTVFNMMIKAGRSGLRPIARALGKLTS